VKEHVPCGKAVSWKEAAYVKNKQRGKALQFRKRPERPSEDHTESDPREVLARIPGMQTAPLQQRRLNVGSAKTKSVPRRLGRDMDAFGGGGEDDCTYGQCKGRLYWSPSSGSGHSEATVSVGLGKRMFRRPKSAVRQKKHTRPKRETKSSFQKPPGIITNPGRNLSKSRKIGKEKKNTIKDSAPYQIFASPCGVSWDRMDSSGEYGASNPRRT